MLNKNHIGSFLISLIVMIGGLTVYHIFFDEPTIVFQNGSLARNISIEETVDFQKLPDFGPIAQKNLPAIVFINTIKTDENGLITNSSGSGVIISPTGHIVTNTHVISNAEKIFVTTFDNKTFEAKKIGKDESTDVAVLKIDNPNSSFASFGDSNQLSVGEWIMLIGNPFKLRNSVSVGVVSAKNRTLDILGESSIESYIQTDAMANPGNSGGGLFNKTGQFMGMISAISTNTGMFQGYSFAIPANIVKKVAFDIINFGVVQRAWLGITIKNIEGEKGVIIERVNRNSAAFDCGLVAEDKILKIDGVKVLNVSQFEELISQYKPGDKISIDYNRRGELKKTEAVLKNNLNTTDLIANRSDDVLLNLGFILRDLTSKEKSELEINGVMVVSVIQNSKISNSNIEPGYIIETINGKSISTVDDFIKNYNDCSGKVQLKGIYRSYPGIFPYVFDK